MTSHNGEAPGHGHVVEGFRSDVRSAVNASEYTPKPHKFQAKYLHRRFNLTPATARLIAELAFGWRAA